MASFWNNIVSMLGPQQDSNEPNSSQQYWDNVFGQMGGDQTLFPNRYAMPTQEVHTEDRGVIPTPGAAPRQPLPSAIQPAPLTDFGNLPRLVMPTQETHTEQRFIDQSVGAEPTATQETGLLGVTAGTMGQDPLALAGYSPGAMNWTRAPRGGGVAEYWAPRPLEYDWANVSDQIRLRQLDRDRGIPSYIGDPDYAAGTRHEYRHRGTEHLRRLADVHGIPFDPAISNLPFERSERVNVFEDRRLGDYGSYQEMVFPAGMPIARGIDERTVAYLRDIADRINSARTQWLHSNPGRTYQDMLNWENYGSPLRIR